MGINMKRAGKHEDALKYYKNAMDIEPDNSIYQYNTGVLYSIKCDFSQAVQNLEQSIENNRENVYAYLALGDAYEKLKEIKKAIYVYRDLMSLGVTVHGLKEKLAYLEN
jgi:tetratricopeptide (TPR) repeat protein